jgi:hypothetical protein
MAALFIYRVAHDWPQHVALWLRRLGGKLGPASDLDGPYTLLAGSRAVFRCSTTLPQSRRDLCKSKKKGIDKTVRICYNGC